MKKNAISRNSANHVSKQNQEVDSKTMTPLRTVGEKEAFYFYEAVGKPTGEVARNLLDFLTSVNTVKLESLVFHIQRRDFQNWVEKTLGDVILAEKLGKISSSKDVSIRTNISRAVKNRIKELGASSQVISIRDNATAIHVRA